MPDFEKKRNGLSFSLMSLYWYITANHWIPCNCHPMSFWKIMVSTKKTLQNIDNNSDCILQLAMMLTTSFSFFAQLFSIKWLRELAESFQSAVSVAAIAANTEYWSTISANKIRSITPFQYFGSEQTPFNPVHWWVLWAFLHPLHSLLPWKSTTPPMTCASPARSSGSMRCGTPAPMP